MKRLDKDQPKGPPLELVGGPNYQLRSDEEYHVVQHLLDRTNQMMAEPWVSQAYLSQLRSNYIEYNFMLLEYDVRMAMERKQSHEWC